MSKRKYFSNVQAEVCHLLEAFEDDDNDYLGVEDFGIESDIASEDGLEVWEEESETELEDSDDDNIVGNSNFYLGQDKITKWFKHPLQSQILKRSQNVLTFLPGVNGTATLGKTPVECWNYIFSDDILHDIVKYTNQYIDSIKGLFSRERDVKHTDLIEIRAFIGLLYLAGAYKANKMPLEELWGTNDDGIAKFSLVMSLKRFKFLIRCLRFDDRNTRAARKEFDRLAPIRDVFEKFVHNCQVSYRIGENVTVDEMLPAFRGNCPFKQYISSKPSKCGIKIFSLVDSKLFYTFNLEIYAGKQNEGPFCVSNKPSDVVKRLAQPLFGSGRIITANTLFTQVSLINELKQKRLFYMGTIRKKQKELPKDFLVMKTREKNSSIFGYSNEGNVLVSFVPRKNKNIVLISSIDEDQPFNLFTSQTLAPEIMNFYNSTKSGVDIVEEMCRSYDVARNIKRWPMVIFFTMLNIASINSQIIHVGNGFAALRRRLFIKQLSNELVLEQISRRSVKSIGMPVQLQQKLKRFTPTQDTLEKNDETEMPKKRQKCETCFLESHIRRLSTHKCKKCNSATCLSHAVFICSPCYDTEEPIDLSY